MHITKFSTRAVALMLCIGALSLLCSSAFASTVVVSPTNMDGWTFYSTDDNGTINTGSATTGMVVGPATPPLGTGSARLATSPGTGDGGAELRNVDWAGTALSSLTNLSYSTYMTSWNGPGGQDTYLNIYVDYNNDGVRDDRLFFEPIYSSGIGGNPTPALNTWQRWDLLTGMWYSDNDGGPGSNSITWADYLTAHPGATIMNDTSQGGPGGIGGIRINAGFASPGDNLDVNVDAFTIGVFGVDTTYDFEPVPEPSTWAAAALAAIMLGTQLFRARSFSKREGLIHARALRH
jgi:hypothetical protein